MRVAGLGTRASNDDPQPIGELWQTFGARAGELGVQGAPHAVYHRYEGNHRAPYSLLVGLPVEDGAELPAGWEAVEIPRGEYLVFDVPEGPMPDVLIATWQAIWSHFEGPGPHQRRYEVDFEVHGPGARVYVGVRSTTG